MANTVGVCLLALSIFCCTNLSSARQVPKECHSGPSYWCQSLRQAADCGAVGHCIATVWETQAEDISSNEISNKFVRLFRQLKDVKDLINADYLSTRVASECGDLPYAEAKQLCKDNTAKLDVYLLAVLTSEVTPETMCRVVGMCNNEKLDFLLQHSNKAGKGVKPHHGKLIGGEKCTWGPSYWCSNFSTGRECKATQHCVQKVWSKMELTEDKDSVCKICLDMVKQARDQLESNETQTELKEVFEGSCKLIPVKIVSHECIKLADDFVPELVETLASQMNPQQVCSVAGLCNNARIDQLLEKYDARLKLHEECNNCQTTAGVLRKRFDATSYEDFLVGLLKVCGRMGSLSDSCSMLIFSYYENIIEALKHDLTAQSVCHVSGQCSFKYHSHDEFEFPVVNQEELKASDDVPCEFCEKLVLHLRDVLVANTTEVQFERVLSGLCKQTGKFKDECLHLVEQYYPMIYNYLVNELKPAEICSMMGLCVNKTKVDQDVNIAPLLPRELAVKAVQITPSSRLIGAEEAKIARIPVTKQANVRIMGSDPAPPPPLPIERMFVAVPQANKFTCTFCESFLHYLQVELSDTENEEKLKKAVEKACDRLPQSLNAECQQFVTEYGPAVIALLVQKIDPSSVCPAMRLCPQITEVRRVDINSEKSNCPLCLFAVEQLETMIKSNRTEGSIRAALENLCNHLSAKLRTQCVDFVDQYSNQLVEMLVANMNAQEICVFLKLCTDDTTHSDPLELSHPSIDKYHEKPELMADRNNRRKPMLPASMLVQHRGGDIETNEIPDDTVNGRPATESSPKSLCIMCEFVMKQIDDEIKDKHNEDEIKKVVHNICNLLPKTVRAECDQFTEKYADLVINLLISGLEPVEVCKKLKLCDDNVTINEDKQTVDSSKSVCIMCEFIMKRIDDDMKDKNNEDEIKKVIHDICKVLPKSARAQCDQFTEKYADMMISLLVQGLDPYEVCKELKLCSDGLNQVKQEILDCAVCETVVMAVKKVMTNDMVDRNIVHIVEKSCGLLPAKYSARCHTMMEIYGDSVIHLIEEMGTKQVCAKIGLCSQRNSAYVQMYGGQN